MGEKSAFLFFFLIEIFSSSQSYHLPTYYISAIVPIYIQALPASLSLPDAGFSNWFLAFQIVCLWSRRRCRAQSNSLSRPPARQAPTYRNTTRHSPPPPAWNALYTHPIIIKIYRLPQYTEYFATWRRPRNLHNRLAALWAQHTADRNTPNISAYDRNTPKN